MKIKIKNCREHVLLVASQILLDSLLLVNHLVYIFIQGNSHKNTNLTCMQPKLHYRDHGFCNVNVIWVTC
jgi:hypothetical protein